MFYVCTTKIIYIQNIDPKLFLINIRFLKTYINIYINKELRTECTLTFICYNLDSITYTVYVCII